MKNIHIIGCGGVTTHLMPPLMLTLEQFPDTRVTLHDGDVYEPSNISRQPFALENEGCFKSEVFAARYSQSHATPIKAQREFIDKHTVLSPTPHLIIAAVDNGKARFHAKRLALEAKCHLIIGANETTQADAFLWSPLQPEHKHPWVLHPSIIDQKPASHEHCDSPEAIADTPQLPIANALAAAGILWFFNQLLSLPDDHKDLLDLWEVLPSHYAVALNRIHTS
jgi:molybdopterin/thiamine biosynthesis adenylyltransferase